MKNNNFKFLIPIVATVLLGLSSFALISIVELKVTIGMLTEEILSIDKQIGRIYSHMDRLMERNK
jgi:hypothetical protein